jgi:hypothetical protein
MLLLEKFLVAANGIRDVDCRDELTSVAIAGATASAAGDVLHTRTKVGKARQRARRGSDKGSPVWKARASRAVFRTAQERNGWSELRQMGQYRHVPEWSRATAGIQACSCPAGRDSALFDLTME